MKREELEELLIAYLDNELPEAQRQVVEEALSRQPELARLRDELRATMDLVAGLPRQSLPPEFAEEITRRIERQVLLTPRARGRPWWVAALVGAGLAAAAGLLVAVLLPIPEPQPIQVAQEAGRDEKSSLATREPQPTKAAPEAGLPAQPAVVTPEPQPAVKPVEAEARREEAEKAPAAAPAPAVPTLEKAVTAPAGRPEVSPTPPPAEEEKKDALAQIGRTAVPGGFLEGRTPGLAELLVLDVQEGVDAVRLTLASNAISVRMVPLQPPEQVARLQRLTGQEAPAEEMTAVALLATGRPDQIVQAMNEIQANALVQGCNVVFADTASKQAQWMELAVPAASPEAEPRLASKSSLEANAAGPERLQRRKMAPAVAAGEGVGGARPAEAAHAPAGLVAPPDRARGEAAPSTGPLDARAERTHQPAASQPLDGILACRASVQATQPLRPLSQFLIIVRAGKADQRPASRPRSVD